MSISSRAPSGPVRISHGSSPSIFVVSSWTWWWYPTRIPYGLSFASAASSRRQNARHSSALFPSNHGMYRKPTLKRRQKATVLASFASSSTSSNEIGWSTTESPFSFSSFSSLSASMRMNEPHCTPSYPIALTFGNISANAASLSGLSNQRSLTPHSWHPSFIGGRATAPPSEAMRRFLICTPASP